MLVEALASGRTVALDRVFTGTSGIGACVVSLIQAVFRSHPHLSLADAVALQRSLAELIVQLGTATETPLADGGRVRLLDSLKAIATLSLDDPGLTPAKVAAEAGMSVRTLHRVFQEVSRRSGTGSATGGLSGARAS